MKNSIFILLLLLVFSRNNVFATKTYDGPSYNLTFSYQNKKIPDTLVVMAYISPFNWDLPAKYYVNKSNGNVFKFRLPSNNAPLRFTIYAYRSGGVKQIGTYYAECDDNIDMNIFESQKKDSITFKGKGASKYALIQQVIKGDQDYNSSWKAPKTNMSLEELKAYLENNTLIIQQATNEKNQLIENFHQDVSKDLKTLIKCQFANYDRYWKSMISVFYFTTYRNNTIYRDIVREYFNSHYKLFIERSNEISILSPDYYAGLISTFNTKVCVNNETNKNGGDIVAYYNYLKEYSDSPVIRERVLCQFLMGQRALYGIDTTSPRIMDSLAYDASKYLYSAEGQAIALRKTKLKSGAPFFDTDFIGLNNESINTSVLKGKVFIIDMWGRGCAGCAQFHKMFDKEIWPQLKDNKNFEFLSVSINLTKEKWIEDLNGGVYSSPEYINAFIGEKKSYTHPFIKYYNISAYPFILLVGKNGQIISKIEGKSQVDSKYLSSLIDKELEIIKSK